MDGTDICKDVHTYGQPERSMLPGGPRWRGHNKIELNSLKLEMGNPWDIDQCMRLITTWNNCTTEITVKVLKIRTPEEFTVITLKFEQGV